MNESFCASENNSSQNYVESNVEIIVKDDEGEHESDTKYLKAYQQQEQQQQEDRLAPFVNKSNDKTGFVSSSPSSESMGQSFCVDVDAPIGLEPLTINQQAIYKNQLPMKKPLTPSPSDSDSIHSRQVILKPSPHVKKQLLGNLNGKKNNRISCMDSLHVRPVHGRFYLGVNNFT